VKCRVGVFPPGQAVTTVRDRTGWRVELMLAQIRQGFACHRAAIGLRHISPPSNHCLVALTHPSESSGVPSGCVHLSLLVSDVAWLPKRLLLGLQVERGAAFMEALAAIDSSAPDVPPGRRHVGAYTASDAGALPGEGAPLRREEQGKRRGGDCELHRELFTRKRELFTSGSAAPGVRSALQAPQVSGRPTSGGRLEGFSPVVSAPSRPSPHQLEACVTLCWLSGVQARIAELEAAVAVQPPGVRGGATWRAATEGAAPGESLLTVRGQGLGSEWR
jgi:hypothetical protein